MSKRSTSKGAGRNSSKRNGLFDEAKPRAARFNLGSKDFLVLSVSILLDKIEAALTQAEFEVCSMVLQGLSNNQIAHKRGTSPRTVANQVASIFRKLEVSSRTELAAMLESSKRKN